MKRREFLANTMALGGLGSFAQSIDASAKRQRTVAEIFVSPNGDDSNAGTAIAPLKSLEAARQLARIVRRTSNPSVLSIWLEGGVHSVTSTLVLGREDGGDENHRVVWAARPSETAVVSSSIAVTGWAKVSQELPGAPRAATGNIWSASLPDGAPIPNVLFDDAGMLQRAQTAPFRHARIVDHWSGSPQEHLTIPVIEKERLKSEVFPAAQSAQVRVIGVAPWTVNYLPIDGIDATAGIIILAKPSTYTMAAPRFYRDAACVWIENTFAGLLRPGNWLVDPADRRLYVWPRSVSPIAIKTPTLTELIRVEGRLDQDQTPDDAVRRIEFRNLQFQHGLRYEHHGGTGLGLQHDWEKYDSPTALLRFRGAENCVVDRCRFTQSGGTGLRLDLYAKRNRVTCSHFSDLGAMAILLAGYGPGLKDTNRNNTIQANTVENVSQLWSSYAIWAWQSGHNIVSGNQLRQLPYGAIAVTGRVFLMHETGEGSGTIRWNEIDERTNLHAWEDREKFLHARLNVIRGNSISNIVQDLDDGNGVYVSGAGRDNRVFENLIYDTPSRRVGEAIRCDDDQNETYISRNVVLRWGCNGVGICSKGRNYIINNVIALPMYAVTRGMISMEPDTTGSTPYGSVVRHNILYTDRPEQALFFKGYLDSLPDRLVRTIVMDENLYYSTVDATAVGEHLEWARARGFDYHSLSADPQFEGLANGDVKLKSGSPARRIGIHSIDAVGTKHT